MKKLILIITWLCAVVSFGQTNRIATVGELLSVQQETEDLARATTFLNAERVAEMNSHCVFGVYVTNVTKGGYTHLGTGFWVTASNSIYLFGVTCDHIVTNANESPIYLGINTSVGFLHAPCIIDYRDTSNDVAVLRPQKSELMRAYKHLGISVPTEMFAAESDFVQGRGVLMVGYPLGLGIEASKEQPVVRLGIVAQNASPKTFLIDGIINHGNSGSPVVALSYNRNPILGMVLSFQHDFIDIKNKEGKTVGFVPYNSGLTTVVKSSVIVEAIRIAKERSNLKE